MNDLFRLEDIQPCDCCISPLERKKQVYIDYYLTELNHMFRYTGGSSNLLWWRIEDLLRRAGAGVFTPYKDNLEFLMGSFNGKPDKLYLPTQFTFANAGLNWSASLPLEDCVVARADHKCLGDLPLLERYCHLIACCDISIELATVNSRATTMAIAGSDRDAEAINKFYEDLREGTLTAIVGRNILNGIKTQPYGNGTTALTDLIEIRQYLISCLCNHYALNSNYNMKREAINSEEAQLDHDALYPYVEDAFECRREFVKGINEKFGEYLDLGELTVEFNGIWFDNFAKETIVTMQLLKGCGSQTSEQTEEPAEPEEGKPEETTPEETPEEATEETTEETTEESPVAEELCETFESEVTTDDFVRDDAVLDDRRDI